MVTTVAAGHTQAVTWPMLASAKAQVILPTESSCLRHRTTNDRASTSPGSMERLLTPTGITPPSGVRLYFGLL